MNVQDVRKKSDKDLQDMLVTLRDRVRELKFKVSSKEVKNHQQLKNVKKDIARVLTILKERENDGSKE